MFLAHHDCMDVFCFLSILLVVNYGPEHLSTQSVFDEEPGLPSPPMDAAALLGVSTASVDMFQVLVKAFFFKVYLRFASSSPRAILT
jgi:hypothetical protein